MQPEDMFGICLFASNARMLTAQTLIILGICEARRQPRRRSRRLGNPHLRIWLLDAQAAPRSGARTRGCWQLARGSSRAF
jgi:hypothetical protein